MPKSKNRKNHKKKVAARGKRIQDRQNMVKNYQRKMIEEMIKKEQEQGLFDEAKIKEGTEEITLDGPDLLDGPELSE